MLRHETACSTNPCKTQIENPFLSPSRNDATFISEILLGYFVQVDPRLQPPPIIEYVSMQLQEKHKGFYTRLAAPLQKRKKKRKLRRTQYLLAQGWSGSFRVLQTSTLILTVPTNIHQSSWFALSISSTSVHATTAIPRRNRITLYSRFL